jgi:hypothetical protein
VLISGPKAGGKRAKDYQPSRAGIEPPETAVDVVEQARALVHVSNRKIGGTPMIQRIFSAVWLAAAAACFASPLYAGAGGVGGGVSVSGGAAVSVAGGHASSGSGFHAGSVAHFSSQGGVHNFHASGFAGQARFGAAVAPSALHAGTTVAPLASHVSTAVTTVAPVSAPGIVNRAFVQTPAGGPTIGFGGSAAAIRGGGRAFCPPGAVTRNWDRDHFHTWNHHRYRCFNGGWIYFDYWPYDDFYTAENDQPYSPVPNPPSANSSVESGQSPENGNANSEQPNANHSLATGATDYGTPDTLILSVQNALTLLGYAIDVSDGRFGTMTQIALSNFQRDHQLPITGHIDAATLRALGLL